MTTTQAKWLERVQQWQASGVRATQFAQGKDYRASTLEWYRTRLKRLGLLEEGARAPACAADEQQRDRGSASKSRVGGTQNRARRNDKKAASRTQLDVSMPIAKVIRRTSAVPHVDAVVIEVGPARIKICPGFDAGLLQQVVHALQGAA